MSTLYELYCEFHPNHFGFLPNECAAIDNDLREYDHIPICEKSLIMLLQRMQEEIDDLQGEVRRLNGCIDFN